MQDNWSAGSTRNINSPCNHTGTVESYYKHWFRARFFQQYRLFFRYHAPSKVIVLAWVNDEDTKRAYGSGDDAYRVFRKMLASGHPPDDWDQLLEEAKPAAGRLQSSMASLKGLE